MNAQHTPGPWRYGGNDHVLTAGPTTFNKSRICAVDFNGVPIQEAQSNARLIASAPELLEALERLLEEADKTGGSVRHVTRYSVDKARQVIAKARGQA